MKRPNRQWERERTEQMLRKLEGVTPMEKTYSADQIRRMRDAYATISELESTKRQFSGPHRAERVRAINKLIERWYTTVEFIKEEE